jgi:hypothetical protein
MTQTSGLVQVASKYSVGDTVQRLDAAFRDKGMQVFAVIDHSGAAEKVGLTMPPTKVVIFGSPKGGTPLMVAAPSLAIDLPFESAGRTRCGGEGLGHIQRSGVSAGAAWGAGRVDQESGGSGSSNRQGCGIMLAASEGL